MRVGKLGLVNPYDDPTQELYWRRACEKDMTYILGARCKDGVVLVGDTKVTIDGGSDSSYGKKITTPFPNAVVMGAAGAGGFYKDFQNRIIKEVFETEINKGKQCFELTRIEGFSILIGKVLKDMNEYYVRERNIFLNNLQILCATRINDSKSQLHLFNPLGFPEPITQYKPIGHGASYGKLFLKNIWKSSMGMEQTAKLGLFVIKCIQDLNLDTKVGYDGEYLPQVFYIPDAPNLQQIKNFPIQELSKGSVNILIKNIDTEITNLDKFLKNFKL